MKFFIFCLIFVSTLNFYVESVVVFCEFKVDNSYGYSCTVKYLKITSKDDRTITDVIGDHLSGRGHSDVTFFDSVNHVVKFFPLKLASAFKNLQYIEIEKGTLSELHGSDLKQFGATLKNLWFGGNAIKVLEEDLFSFNPNLQYVNFDNNKIKHVDPETFTSLEKLSILKIDGNPCIQRSVTTRNDVINLITEIDDKCKDFPFMLKKFANSIQEQLSEMRAKVAEVDNLKAEVNAVKALINEMESKRQGGSFRESLPRF